MDELAEAVVSINTTGSAGTATGSGTSESLSGYLEDIYFDFHASAPATTDTTVAFATRGGNIIVLSNTATDALKAPLQQAHDAAGAAITGVYKQFLLNQPITISLAQCDELTAALVVRIRYYKI